MVGVYIVVLNTPLKILNKYQLCDNMAAVPAGHDNPFSTGGWLACVAGGIVRVCAVEFMCA